MTVRALEIFRSGTHVPQSGESITFTDADIARIAAGYDPVRASAPLTIGHPLYDEPKLGRVLALAANDGRLFALAEVDEPLVAGVRAGRYRNVSSSFHSPDSSANPTPGRYALKHVGFLGSTPPAVRGMQPLCFAACAPSTIEFAAPAGYAVDPTDLAVYRAAMELHAVCPSLPFIECARRAARAL